MAKNETAAPGKEIGRKLSVRELGLEKADLQKLTVNQQEVDHFLGRFVGVATGLKPYKIKEGDRAGETAYGLMGQFSAEGNGRTVEGSVLYLPGYVNDAIVAIFSADEDVSSVRIAYDVYARYDATSATSYVFSVRDLLNQGSQSVDEIKAEIGALPMPPATIAIEDKSGS